MKRVSLLNILHLLINHYLTFDFYFANYIRKFWLSWVKKMITLETNTCQINGKKIQHQTKCQQWVLSHHFTESQNQFLFNKIIHTTITTHICYFNPKMVSFLLGIAKNNNNRIPTKKHFTNESILVYWKCLFLSFPSLGYLQ